MPPQRNENWKQRAQEMRQQSRQAPVPTYQQGYGQMPDLPGHYPHNPNNADQLQRKLAYQQALHARQAWLNTGNRPGQNYPDLPAQPVPQTPAQTVTPTIPYRGHGGNGGGTPGYGGQYNPGVGLPQPQPRRSGKRGRYPDLTY